MLKSLIYLCSGCILVACSLAGPAVKVQPGSTLSPAEPAGQAAFTPAAAEETPEISAQPTPTVDKLKRGDAPAAPAPLTNEARENCPLSLPNGKLPPGEIDSGGYFGNESETMFTVLWPDGIVLFTPGGAGHIAPDGTLSMKWPWFRTVEGDVIIGGRRLDAVSPPMPAITLRGEPDGYGETGFHPSSLTWPGEGCWEVTARVGRESLTFVTLVIRAP